MRVFILTLFFKCEPGPLQEHVAAELDARGWRVKTTDGDDGLFVSRDGDDAGVYLVNTGLPVSDGEVAAIDHRFGADPAAIAGCAKVELTPRENGDLGDPVERLREMAAIALALVDDRVTAIWWGGARSLISPDLFQRSVGAWLADGAFPALGFTALERDGDGLVHSIGLGLLAGQEIAVHPGGLANSPPDQARLAIRVIDFLVREGPLMQSQSMDVEGFGPVRFEIEQNKGNINLYC
ncbi:hypothetical protein [Croceicoccus mobilis]|uniref:DUF4261 domain-containing protein n=1 Tax=Croceicoccus mobilis TaxID=1703339 RepID=A0A916YXI7_9SPHN|nr:hypothetical protein [Croceicoccus mobilis]GGD66327.1 hypothetical protein GCM10010990_14790 [Croceicoccus mobilis]